MPGCSVMAVMSVSSKGGLVRILTKKSTVGCLKNMKDPPKYLARSRSSLLADQKLCWASFSWNSILSVYCAVHSPPPKLSLLKVKSSECVV